MSRNALIDILKADLYHATGIAVTDFSEKLPTIQGKLVQQIIKDTYDLSFVSLPQGYDENEFYRHGTQKLSGTAQKEDKTAQKPLKRKKGSMRYLNIAKSRETEMK